MPRHLPSLPVILALTFGAAAADAAEKDVSICTNGDLVRRVIIDVGDLNTGLPCEVVYWKDKEAPGVRRVLWNARSDAAFCDAKAAGLVDKLTSSGWRCDRNGEAAASTVTAPSAALPPAPTPIPAPTAPATAAVPKATVPSVDAATVANSTAVVPQPSPATTAPSAQLPATAPAQTAALATPAAPAPAEAAGQLQTVITENLTSLNKSVDGDFKAQIGQFGDLNSDGIEDAVVFFNYQSSSADFTQFVAAYLFNGESYHLAATKPVGGTDRAVQAVEIESIVDGSIQLKLQLNDASKTENRRAAMVLRDGQLVEIE